MTTDCNIIRFPSFPRPDSAVRMADAVVMPLRPNLLRA